MGTGGEQEAGRSDWKPHVVKLFSRILQLARYLSHRASVSDTTSEALQARLTALLR